MSTYTQIYYHVIFSTKHRRPVLVAENRPELFSYIWGILKNKNCHLYRINAVDDHVHLFFSLHPSVALADLVKDVKVSSSLWIHEKGLFPGFEGWQKNYSAFTHSARDQDVVIEYIKGQEEHHEQVSFADELRNILEEVGVKIDEKYFP